MEINQHRDKSKRNTKRVRPEGVEEDGKLAGVSVSRREVGSGSPDRSSPVATRKKKRHHTTRQDFGAAAIAVDTDDGNESHPQPTSPADQPDSASGNGNENLFDDILEYSEKARNPKRESDPTLGAHAFGFECSSPTVPLFADAPSMEPRPEPEPESCPVVSDAPLGQPKCSRAYSI